MTYQFKIDKYIAPKELQIIHKSHEEAHIKQEAPEEAQVLENCEISISYVHMGEKWDLNNIAINNIFTFQVAHDIIKKMKILNHEMWKNANIEMIG